MEEEEEIGLKSSRKRKTAIIESSSDDEKPNRADSKTPDGACQESSSIISRSSARIAKRRSRSFEMPTREKVWKTITPSKSPAKIHQLAPRKLVNNFTKENHRYNYDPNYTSGEESMEDFLVDDFDEDVVSESSSSPVETKKPKKKQPKKRLKNRRERVIIETSSDTDSEVGESRNITRRGDKRKSVALESSSEQSEDDIQDFRNRTEKCNEPALSVGRSTARHSHCESGFEDCGNANVAEEDDTDNDIIVTPCGKRRKSNIINSDDESEQDGRKNGEHSEENRGESVHSNKNVEIGEQQKCGIMKDDAAGFVNGKDSSVNLNIGPCRSDAKVDVSTGLPGTNIKPDDEETENNTSTQSHDTVDLVTDSSSDEESDETEEESDSEIDDIAAHNERARVQMLKKKKAKLKLFERFREERKRKFSKGDKSG